MYQRFSKPLLSNSFFIFGARGAGKSTLVRQILTPFKPLEFDLLRPDDEERLSRNPLSLVDEINAHANLEWVLIDEIQKIPKLLDVVHFVLETDKTRHIKFALTGSSARKLKLSCANLLAGRAFVNDLYPLSCRELGERFNLVEALNWGTLPRVVNATEDEERREFLRAYVRTYLKEDIWSERLVHNLDPFRKFLEIAATANGMIINYSAIARQTGVDDKTVKKYFEILADTFVGFYLEAYSLSVRSQQIMSPKFYIFDPGVKRAMEGLLHVPVAHRTFAFGMAFEHFILCECVRLNSYLRLDYRFSYLKTKDDAEIDLVIERPGQNLVLVEIKSGDSVDETDARTLKRFNNDFPNSELFIWSNDPRPKQFGPVRAVPWQDGLREVGFI